MFFTSTLTVTVPSLARCPLLTRKFANIGVALNIDVQPIESVAAAAEQPRVTYELRQGADEARLDGYRMRILDVTNAVFVSFGHRG